jgi:hypothetical protein
MNTKEILIEKQREYIALLLNESVISDLIEWQERCKLLDIEIKLLEERLAKNSKKEKDQMTKEEAKKIADKVRGLKGTDWGLSF